MYIIVVLLPISFVSVCCRCFSCFALDVIASVAFGTQVDSHKNPDNPLVRYGQMYFSLSFFRPFNLFQGMYVCITQLKKNHAKDETKCAN